jgi:hypothetical protein
MARPGPFETRDRYGRTIKLSPLAAEHIRAGHPEVTHEAIRVTVESPQLIFESAQVQSAELFFRQGVDRRLKYNPLMCKVVVGFWEHDRGSILTAVYQPGVQGSKDIGGLKFCDYGKKPR